MYHNNNKIIFTNNDKNTMIDDSNIKYSISIFRISIIIFIFMVQGIVHIASS